MKTIGARLPALILAFGLLLLAGDAMAASSLGIGIQEPTLGPTGPFGHFFFWISDMQAMFYRAMTTALKGIRTSVWSAPLMVGLSFAYGVFHAVGPGHGKAVISSYVIANETTLKRGVFLSLVSSLLQGITAILVVGAAWLVLRGTTIRMTDAAQFMERASFAMVAAFGLWLLWQKAPGFLRAWFPGSPRLAAAKADCGHAHDHEHHRHGHDEHHHGPREVCASCGHAHVPDPSRIGGEFNWKTASSAIASVGLRPCSGALIVLTFALLNGLVLGGVLSVFAMSLGTFITVATLATLAVTAKNVAMRFAGSEASSARLHSLIEVAGALLVALVGGVLLTATFYT